MLLLLRDLTRAIKWDWSHKLKRMSSILNASHTIHKTNRHIQWLQQSNARARRFMVLCSALLHLPEIPSCFTSKPYNFHQIYERPFGARLLLFPFHSQYGVPVLTTSTFKVTCPRATSVFGHAARRTPPFQWLSLPTPTTNFYHNYFDGTAAMEPLASDPEGSHRHFPAPAMSVQDILPQSSPPLAFNKTSVFDLSGPTIQSESGLFPNGKGRSKQLFANVETDHNNHVTKTPSRPRQGVSTSMNRISASDKLSHINLSPCSERVSSGFSVDIASGINSLRGRALDAFSSIDRTLSLQTNSLANPEMGDRGISQMDDFISFKQTIPFLDQPNSRPGLQGPTEYSLDTGALPKGLSKNTAIDLTSDDDPVPPFLSQRNQHRGNRKLIEEPNAKRITRSRARESLKTGKISKQSKGPDLQLLVGHRHLRFWKDKHYQEMGIDAEYQLVLSMGRAFKPSSIQTIVPDRYLRPMLKQGHRRPAFPGVIVAGGRPVEAIRKAYEEHTSGSQDFRRLVFWTDGSGCGRSSGRGMGVVFRTTLLGGVGWSPWMARGYVSVGKKIETSEVEGLAMVKAIDLACEMIRAEPNRFTAIAIYTDALTVLDQLRAHSPRPLCERIVKKALGLRREGSNPTITLHWCPGHSKVRYLRSF
jgi:hypothetical protein